MELTTAQLDRVCGVLLGTAAGDALGAGYEFGPPLPDTVAVAMRGGGSFDWAPGEWTDDTSMSVAIAEVAADGSDLREPDAQDRVVARWAEWAKGASDVGNQTRAVLSGMGDPTAANARAASEALHTRTGHTAGNGSLMRTAAVGLAYLEDEDALAAAARSISELTHWDAEASEACVLWCMAIHHAVLTGELDARAGLAHLPSRRRREWADRISLAEESHPSDFRHNGWVVEALQAAWCAIATTPVPLDDPAGHLFQADHLRRSLEAAVRGGRDTDTVAAIAGGLLGAAYGASAVPAQWRLLLHGWPGLRARDLVDLGAAITRGGDPDPFDLAYSGVRARTCVQHPYDDGLWLGDLGALRSPPPEVDAIVSLCRVDAADVPPVAATVEVHLLDRVGATSNLGFVLDDTVSVIERLRAAGRTVLVHCVQAQSRTPTVAALYAMRRGSVSHEQALADVTRVLPATRPNTEFLDFLRAFDA